MEASKQSMNALSTAHPKSPPTAPCALPCSYPLACAPLATPSAPKPSSETQHTW